MAKYKYGEPDKYGEFPYLYCNKYKKEELVEILKERLPESYPMQIVDDDECTVLADCVNQGIDSHLEACTMTEPSHIVDRTTSNGNVYQHHLQTGFDKEGMICLIRRLMEYNPRDHWDFTGCEPSEEHKEESQEERDLWDAANNLVSSILETVQIEYSGC
jgi:hypothetical protein